LPRRVRYVLRRPRVLIARSVMPPLLVATACCSQPAMDRIPNAMRRTDCQFGWFTAWSQ
jgi:hypothetical protein